VCVICSKASKNGLCSKCSQKTKINAVVSFFKYDDELIQSIIKTTKYSGHFDALRCWSEHAASLYQRAILNDNWVVTFIPQSSRTTQRRGFNQAEELARLLFKDAFPIKRLLVKSRETLPQAQQDKLTRLKNLKGSMRATGKVPPKIIICDDVITTGSTMKEAAHTLKKAGAKEIIALTIAHG
jgi:ComF family protein